MAETTNDRMELAAIRQALSRAPAGIALEQRRGWVANGWKRKNVTLAAICRDIEGLAAQRGGKGRLSGRKGLHAAA